jgi:hypothetical protein
MRSIVVMIGGLFVLATAAWAEPPDGKEAAGALRRAVEFYRTKVAAHGGYVYRYAADLSKREGEGKTGPDTVWVQPDARHCARARPWRHRPKCGFRQLSLCAD